MIQANGVLLFASVLGANREDVGLGFDLNNRSEVLPGLRPLQFPQIAPVQGCAYLFSVISPVNAVRYYEAPEAHKRANGRIHRQKVTIEHLGDSATDMHFGSPAVIGTHNLSNEFGRKLRLHLAPGLNTHLSQVSFAEARLAVNLMDRSIGKPKLFVPRSKGFIRLPGRLGVSHRVVDIFRRECRPVLVGIELLTFHIQEVCQTTQRKRSARQGGGDCSDIDKATTPGWYALAPFSHAASRSLFRWRVKSDQSGATGEVFDLDSGAVFPFR